MIKLVNLRASLVALILVCTGLFVMPAAHAQTPEQVTAQANVSWVLPTTDTLGGALTGVNALTKVQLFVSTSSIPDNGATPTVELSGADTTYQYQQSVPNGTTLYFRVAACNAVCSALSAQDTKPIYVSVPGVPTGVTVTVQINLMEAPQ